MNSSFCNIHYTKPSKSKTTAEFVTNLPKTLISENFKVAASIRETIKELESLLKLSKVVLKFVSETSSK